jgi:hypothetical protein
MNELTKKQKVIMLRSGVEIWIEEEYANRLKSVLLNSKETKFIEIDDSVINSTEIIGIFTPQELEDATRRKNGQWKDKNGKWRNRGDRVCPTCDNIVPYGKVCGNC